MRAQHFSRGDRGGFSLTELIVVMGIISMILGFAAPAIVGVLRGKKVEQAVGALTGILESARMDAITQNAYYWTGVASVKKSTPTASGQDELWVMTFRGTQGENRVPADPASVVPTSILRRVEGVGLVPQGILAPELLNQVPATAKDMAGATPSTTPLNWGGSGGSGSMSFNRLVLFTPRGEALLETGGTGALPVPEQYLAFCLARTMDGKPIPNEKDVAVVLISGISGRVSVVRQ
ncbi:MAG: prepilin-type N-terminal cleavage/methylation domain-containing protein [Verrucomicrobia bacterium]|nr:prepilin-type N-terminal cleavage/methylation domain-containing protein [Verrucomicrobiota bacterium]